MKITRIEDGFLYPPERPGLGTTLQPALFERSDTTVQSSDLVDR